MLVTLKSRDNNLSIILLKINCNSLMIMHAHQCCSKHSLSYYLDTYSEAALHLITRVTYVLTHSFRIANANNFQFNGFILGQGENGNARVVMILCCVSTRTVLEEHLDILPTLDFDAQLLTNLIMMMERLRPRLSICHTCCSHLIETPV